MTSQLSGSLAATVGKAFNSLFLDASLARDVPVISPDPADPLPPQSTTYGCKAINDQWSSYYQGSGLVGAAERKILILATSLAVTPEPGDRITIDGGTFTILPNGSGKPAVATDPAKAVWECRALA